MKIDGKTEVAASSTSQRAARRDRPDRAGGQAEHSSAIRAEALDHRNRLNGRNELRPSRNPQPSTTATVSTVAMNCDPPAAFSTVATLDEMVATLCEAIEETEAFAHMRVNRRNLMRHLVPLVKKNCAAEDGDEGETSDAQRKAFAELWRSIFDGLTAWTDAWAADGWQYAPGKITKWLADEKWLQPPRKKAAAASAVGAGCGDCGAEIA